MCLVEVLHNPEKMKKYLEQMEELKSCPFCGSKADIHEEAQGEDTLDYVWVISCENCPCQMVGDRNDRPSDFFPDEKLLTINAWNKRGADE